jgi:hypothetical protein
VELDINLAAAERTEEARRLIDTARSDGIVSLGALGGMDLCILGGPMHSVFPEALAKAWLSLGDRARQKLIDERTADMAKRGMLTPPPPGGYGYALAPAVGLALAARCRPTFVVTASASPSMRPLCFFALGDQTEPVRGLVIEVPAPPSDNRKFPQQKKLGPLGWLYSYALVTPEKAAYMLAEHVSSPSPGVPVGPGQPPYAVTLYRAGDGLQPAAELSVLGDGTTAQVTGANVNGEYDKAALQQILLGLFAYGTPAI